MEDGRIAILAIGDNPIFNHLNMINESNEIDTKKNKSHECIPSGFADSSSSLSSTLNSISSLTETASLLASNSDLTYQNLSTIVKEPKIESINSPDFLFSNQLNNQHQQ